MENLKIYLRKVELRALLKNKGLMKYERAFFCIDADFYIPPLTPYLSVIQKYGRPVILPDLPIPVNFADTDFPIREASYGASTLM